MQDRLDELLANGPFDLVLVHDQELGRYRFNTGVPLVLIEHEVRYPRRFDRSVFGLPLRPARVMRELDWHRWSHFQKTVWQRFDSIQAFTERDATTIIRLDPSLKDRVHVNPFGAILPPAGPTIGDPDRLLFVGSFGHWPNVDAAVWLAREIMPRIRSQYPTAHLDIVGSGPPPAVQELQEEDIDVIGEVPDVAPYLARASVVVAPVRVGGGMRVKVLQAMAAGRPVVTTARGAEGLEVDGEVPPILIADEADDFARATVSLLENSSLRQETGIRAGDYVRKHFTPGAHGRRLEAQFEALLTSSDGGGETVAGRPTSVLELAHPQGMASNVLVLGKGCPRALLPELRPTRVDSADLIMIWPHRNERRSGAWFDRAVRTACEKLRANGAIFVAVSPTQRYRVSKQLRRRGIVVETAFLHLPDYGMTGCLVPMDRSSLRYVVANVLPIAEWKRRAGLALLRLPGAGRALSYLLPSVTLVARPRGSDPLFRWLLVPEREKARGDRVVITRSWRGEDGPVGPVALHVFQQHAATPAWVAKLDVARLHYDQGREVGVEADALCRLGPDAQTAEAHVPLPVSLETVGEADLLIEAGVPGQPIESRLAADAECLPHVLPPLVHWLGKWSSITCASATATAPLFQEHILRPAAHLAPYLKGGAGYEDWLAGRCRALIGATVPLVATHNDLNMKNVFLDPEGGLGVIDWATGHDRFFPLVDFYYAVFDAVVVTQGYRDHLLAYEKCFSPTGEHRALVERFEWELARILRLDDDVRALCFHACWLHHAANQLRFGDREGHFVQIVQRLALQSTDTQGEDEAS